MIRVRKGWHSYALGVGRLTVWWRHRPGTTDFPRLYAFVRAPGDPFA